METFLSGFAKGYIAERDRRLTEETRKDEIKFKYKMDALVEQRDLRTKKKKEEEERYRIAQSLANQMGDPDATGTFYTELSNKVDPETLQKRIAEGAYQKNPNFTKPTQTLKVPNGVVPAVSTDIPGTDGEGWEQINADIDAIDPTLRASTQDDGTSYVAETNTAYIFKPQDEVKVGSFADADYKYKLALESKDPVAIRKAKLALDSHKDIETFRAQQKAKQEGKSGTVFGITDAKGNLISTFVGEAGTDDSGKPAMFNTSDPRGRSLVPIAPDQGVVTLSEDQNKRRFGMLQRKREEVEKYKAAAGAYGAALNNQLMLEDLVTKHPNVTFAVTELAVVAKSLEGNAKTAIDLLAKQDASTQAAFQSGDPEAIESATARFEQQMTDTLKGGILSEAVKNEAVAKAVYNSLLTNAVYQFAAANGINGRDMSDKDVAQFKNMIAEGGADAILTNLDNINQSVLIKLMNTENNFGKDPEMQALMDEIGVSGIDNVSLPRVGDILDGINPSGTLRTKQDMIRKRIQDGTMTAAMRAAQAAEKQETPEERAKRENVTVKVPLKAAEALKKNPKLKDEFDRKYGAGEAAKILGE